jgi:hypothetical protein
MDKLKELLKGIGASEELTGAICEELGRYTTSLKARYDQEYQTKIERAKQVCVEEVNKEKASLARRVKTFMESKAATMEQAANNKRAIEESESANKLRKMKAIAEGVELTDNGATSQELQDAQKKIARLEKAFGQLKEERNSLLNKANTANDIAAKTLARNRALEEQVATEGYCKEHHLPYPKSGSCAKCGGGSEDDAPKGEEKMEEGKKPSTARLDESRQKATAKSTRRTLTESQTRTSAKAAVRPQSEVDKIADTIE